MCGLCISCKRSRHGVTCSKHHQGRLCRKTGNLRTPAVKRRRLRTSPRSPSSWVSRCALCHLHDHANRCVISCPLAIATPAPRARPLPCTETLLRSVCMMPPLCSFSHARPFSLPCTQCSLQCSCMSGQHERSICAARQCISPEAQARAATLTEGSAAVCRTCSSTAQTTAYRAATLTSSTWSPQASASSTTANPSSTLCCGAHSMRARLTTPAEPSLPPSLAPE